MQIGIGLPNPVKGTPGRRLVEWGQRAEQAGFSGLVTIDRIAYPNLDSLATLAAVGGATSRIGLMTNVLLAPVYPPVLLAKQAASIDQLTGGRLTLGMSVGGRPDDYELAGRDFHTRGRDFDDALSLLHAAWRGEPVGGSDQPVGPVPVNDARVPILIGGTGEKAIARTARWGDGWTMGGGSPDDTAPIVEKVRAAWREAGRDGEPRIAALAYFSLGDDATDDSLAYLRDYYAFLGDWTETIAQGALRSEDAVRGAVAAFEAAGVTELYFDPTTASLDQVDRLAAVVL
jgi:alkanesulfonate monooxygenase SsuD/methylene tetrahydromethanopterin reductase-like flavin-dependent oxidoreductase (luciferase family)